MRECEGHVPDNPFVRILTAVARGVRRSRRRCERRRWRYLEVRSGTSTSIRSRRYGRLHTY